MLKKILLTTIASLFTIVGSLPANATPKQTYDYTYNAIATSDSDIYSDERFRAYILKWLKQDKSYPEEIARDYCLYKQAGWSNENFVKLKVSELVQTSILNGWSESRRKAYFNITGVSVVAGLRFYCPAYLSTFGEDDI